MGSPERPSKREVFLTLLREGWTSLHLDARRAGVMVPAHLKHEAHLVLQYGHDLPIPIPDLAIDELGVSATLSFARTPHYTVVPWSAVYVVASDDGRGVLYQEDIPRDVSVLAARADELGDGPAAPPARALRAVPLSGDSGDDVPDSLSDAVASARRRRRPQLRLVK